MKWKDKRTAFESRLDEMRRQLPHQVLGVVEGASKEIVRAKYLLLVKTYHPDVADPFMRKHNEEALKIVNGAYAKLYRSQA